MMKFFKNKLSNRAIFSSIATFLLFFLGSTHYSRAQGLFGIGSLESGVLTIIAEGVSYLISILFGVIIAIEAWVIGMVLNLNATILQTTLVQTGFSVSLSIANLAFVLGIIVIALATILRNQTYGIKQLLWKLVVMAILINFGLVIMSPIFALGNSFTQYFLNCINPGAGGCSQNASSISSFDSFGLTMAGAFNPAKPLLVPDNITGSDSAAIEKSGIAGSLSVTGGSSLSAAIVPILSMFFVAINLILIAVVLGVFVVLLTIRYLYIAMLAILLPFAWASWVFPSFSEHWKKWWNLFIRWTFFAPIVLFFVYLALLTMKSGSNAFNLTQYQKGGTWDAISNFFTAYYSPIISALLQEVILGGLIITGLIVGNSMGIKMAGAAVNYAEKKGKSIGNRAAKWAKNKGIRAASYPLRTQVGRNITQKVQTLGVGSNSIIKAGLAPVRATGNFIANRREATEKLVSDRQKDVGKKSLLEQARQFGRQDPPGQLAILTNIDKALKNKDAKKAAEFKEAMKTLPKNIQQVLKDLREKSQDIPQDASLKEKASIMWNNKNQLDRLKVLYGKNEPFADDGNDAQKALDAHKVAMAKKEENGEEITEAEGDMGENLERLVKAQEEASQKNVEEQAHQGTLNRRVAEKQGQKGSEPIIIIDSGSGKPPRSSVTFNPDGTKKPKEDNS